VSQKLIPAGPTKKLRTALYTVAAALVIAIAGVGAAKAVVVVTIEEIGGDVGLSATGTLDVSSLDYFGFTSQGHFINPQAGGFGIGIGSGSGNNFGDAYTGISAFEPFGSGGLTVVGSGSGDKFGLAPGIAGILLPAGFQSGDSINASTTIASATLSSLGLLAGSYTYSWDSDSILLNITASVVPLPAALPLFVGGLASMGVMGWRKRRQNPASA